MAGLHEPLDQRAAALQVRLAAVASVPVVELPQLPLPQLVAELLSGAASAHLALAAACR